MALNGNLSTMPATDVLQWIAQAQRTGTLKIEREQVCKRIQFQAGRVVGCSSNDSSFRLGQVLLSRGLIEEQQLRKALGRQQTTGENIGDILIALGAIDQDDLDRVLTAKAEETIFGLFDWEDAVFRFVDELESDPYLIQVDLEVQDVILRGLQRFDEMKRFRGVFADGNVVLVRTGTPAPAEVTKSRMARRIFDSINGERTLAEITLHARSSEYLVTKFLFQLHRLGIIEVVEARLEPELEVDLPDLGDPGSEPPMPDLEAVDGVETGAESEREAYDLDVDGAFGAEPPEQQAGKDLSAEIGVAERLMEQGEHEAALELLTAVYRAHAGETYLREMISRAEQAVELAHRATFAPDRVPVLRCSHEKIRELGLSPEASFLPSLIDGDTDIRSILWLAPMSTVDVLRTLRQMLDRGVIELLEPGQQAKAG